MSIGAINSSMQGIQRGLQNLNKAAQDTASASINRGVEVESIAESAVKARQAEIQVKASAEALKAEDAALGALLDVRA